MLTVLCMIHEANQFRKHVLSDLRPYVCIFESCGLRMFESQHEWFQHELQFHRKQWTCQICPGNFAQTGVDLEKHLFKDHSNVVTDMDTFLQTCLMPRIERSCPLCVDLASAQHTGLAPDISLRRYREHLGRHMEQLAMSALPYEDDRDDESVSDDESVGNDSDSDHESISAEDLQKHHEALDAISVIKIEMGASRKSLSCPVPTCGRIFKRLEHLKRLV